MGDDDDPFKRKPKVPRSPKGTSISDLINLSENLRTIDESLDVLNNVNTSDSGIHENTGSLGDNTIDNTVSHSRSFINVLPIDLNDSLVHAFAQINVDNNTNTDTTASQADANLNTQSETHAEFVAPHGENTPIVVRNTDNNTNSDTTARQASFNLNTQHRTREESTTPRNNTMALSLSDMLKGIPEFSCKSQPEINTFIANVDMIYDLCAEAQKPQCLTIIRTRLVNAQKLGDITNSTWADMRSKIKERYKLAISFDTAQERLLAIKQSSKETLDEYAERTKKLLDLLNNSIIEGSEDTKAAYRKMNEDLAIKRFKQNILDEKIRMLALSSEHKSFYDAVAHATEKSEQLASSNVANTQKQQYSDKKEKPKTPDEKTKNKQKCDFCNKRGHSADRCFSKRKQEQQASGSGVEINKQNKTHFQQKQVNKNSMNVATEQTECSSEGSDDSEYESIQSNSFKLQPYQRHLN